MISTSAVGYPSSECTWDPENTHNFMRAELEGGYIGSPIEGLAVMRDSRLWERKDNKRRSQEHLLV